MQTPETRTERRFFLGEHLRELALEEVTPRHRHALEQFPEEQASDVVFGSHVQFPGYFQILSGDIIHTATTTTHANVIGTNTFHPRRMIWS